MISFLKNLLAVALVVSVMPLVGHAQDNRADSAERAHRKAVVKKDWHKTKDGVNKAYHKAKHAPGKAIHKLKAKHAQHEANEPDKGK